MDFMKIFPCVSHGLCWFPSVTCLLLPKPCPFNYHCLSPTSTRSFQTQSLDSHSNHVLSSLTTHQLTSHLHHVHSSSNAHLPPPPYPSEPKCLFPTSIISNQAQMVTSCLHCVHLSTFAHFSSSTCWFKLEHLSSTSIVSSWVQTFTFHHHYVSPSSNLPPPLC